MKFKDKAAWDKTLAAQTDAYGKRVMSYAEDWANLIEARMAAGEKLEDVAAQTSHEADTDGITGFMYGAAVSILAFSWEYGDQLRRWHNLKVQLSDEGERANKTGGTLNPALLRLGK